jgi:hypothetical protein
MYGDMVAIPGVNMGVNIIHKAGEVYIVIFIAGSFVFKLCGVSTTDSAYDIYMGNIGLHPFGYIGGFRYVYRGVLEAFLD